MLQPKVMSKLEKPYVTKRCPVICLYKHNAYVWDIKGLKAKISNETCIHAKKTTSFVEPIMNVRLVLIIFWEYCVLHSQAGNPVITLLLKVQSEIL